MIINKVSDVKAFIKKHYQSFEGENDKLNNYLERLEKVKESKV